MGGGADRRDAWSWNWWLVQATTMHSASDRQWDGPGIGLVHFGSQLGVRVLFWSRNTPEGVGGVGDGGGWMGRRTGRSSGWWCLQNGRGQPLERSWARDEPFPAF